MKVLVVGLGAIGGSIAVKLSSISDVSILTRRADIVDTLNHSGISLTLLNQEVVRAYPRVITSIGDEKWDLVVLAVRAYDLESTLESILASLDIDTPVLALTNGIVMDIVHKYVGDRAVCASVDLGVGANGDGDYFVKIDGGLRIGDKVGGQVASRVKGMISDAIDTQVVDDIVSATYAKVIINSVITSTAIVTGAKLKDIVTECKPVLDEIVFEAMKVAKVADIKVTSYKGMSFYVFCRKDMIGSMFRHVTWKYISTHYGDRKSTTVSRLASGIKSEADYFTGYVVSLAKQYAVSTPINEAILDMVHKVESGELTPDISNLKGLI